MDEEEVVEVRSVHLDGTPNQPGERPYSEVGKRIRKALRDNAMLQMELAEKLGVSDRTVGAWVSGEWYPEGANLRNLAKVLKVSSGWIMSGDDDLEELRESVRNLSRRVEDLERRLDG